MSDIVKRLRNTYEWVGFPAVPLCVEAADEIERLRSLADDMGRTNIEDQKEIDRQRAEKTDLLKKRNENEMQKMIDYWGKRAEKAEADLELRRMVYYGDIIIMTSEIEQMCEEIERLTAEVKKLEGIIENLEDTIDGAAEHMLGEDR